MKKSITFLALLSVALLANAQREYRDGQYKIIGHHGNKIDVAYDDVYNVQQTPFSEDDVIKYDDVVETNNNVKNVLVKDYQTINYYHENIVKENHYYFNNHPIYRVKRPPMIRNYNRPRIKYDEYSPVESSYYEERQNSVYGNKWFFYFQLNSDFLTNKTELGHLIDFAKSNPSSLLYVDSYSDADTGTYEYNMYLSRRRADSIIKILLSEGVSKNRIFVNNHGCIQQPYNTNYLNRCVTIKIVN